MAKDQKEVQQDIPGKKELKQQLTDKMEIALPELRAMLGEKKFAHRLKKAAKLLVEGLHKEDVSKKKQPTGKASPTGKAAVKKSAGKKAAIAKPVTHAAKAAPAKKAKSTKKGSTARKQ